MYEIELKCPSSLHEALEFLAAEPDIKPIAGGTDLLPLIHKEPSIEHLKAMPIFIDKEFDKFKLVDLSNLKVLRGIVKTKYNIEIGSGTTHAELATNSIINQHYPSLTKATSQIGSPQIRTRGTIGGNIANASPSADTVPPLMVLKAEIELTSVAGIRKLPLGKFFIAPGETIIKSNEIITKIILPLPSPNTVQFYKRLAIRKIHACAKASVAFCAIKKNSVLTDINITFGAVGPTAISAYKTAGILEGKNLAPSLIEQAVQQAMQEINPIDDIRSTKEYRKAMIGELLRQELEKLLLI